MTRKEAIGNIMAMPIMQWEAKHERHSELGEALLMAIEELKLADERDEDDLK